MRQLVKPRRGVCGRLVLVLGAGVALALAGGGCDLIVRYASTSSGESGVDSSSSPDTQAAPDQRVDAATATDLRPDATPDLSSDHDAGSSCVTDPFVALTGLEQQLGQLSWQAPDLAVLERDSSYAIATVKAGAALAATRSFTIETELTLTSFTGSTGRAGVRLITSPVADYVVPSGAWCAIGVDAFGQWFVGQGDCWATGCYGGMGDAPLPIASSPHTRPVTLRMRLTPDGQLSCRARMQGASDEAAVDYNIGARISNWTAGGELALMTVQGQAEFDWVKICPLTP